MKADLCGKIIVTNKSLHCFRLFWKSRIVVLRQEKQDLLLTGGSRQGCRNACAVCHLVDVSLCVLNQASYTERVIGNQLYLQCFSLFIYSQSLSTKTYRERESDLFFSSEMKYLELRPQQAVKGLFADIIYTLAEANRR